MTTPPDFRALCAALLEEVDALPFQYDWRGNAVGPLADFDCTVMDSVRAALDAVPATPAPVPVPPESLPLVLSEDGKPWDQTMDGRLWARAFVSRWGGDEGLMLAWFCNAIMAGWDHAHWRMNENNGTPAPVPVAERLPEASDCVPWPDGRGEPWCWFGKLIHDDEDVYFQWVQCWPKYGITYGYTHWRPHWALPLPEHTK